MGSIILGGGRGSRLGRNKTQLVVGGEDLLRRIVDRLGFLGESITLVLARGQEGSHWLRSRGVMVATDRFAARGPMGGVYSGLKAAGEECSVVVACDMPFLNVDLLRYMRGLAPGFDLVIPRVDMEVEPLHAVYSRNCLGFIEEMIREGDLKVRNLLERVRVRYVEDEEVEAFDPEHLSFFNINTPDDLRRAEEIMARERL